MLNNFQSACHCSRQFHGSASPSRHFLASLIDETLYLFILLRTAYGTVKGEGREGGERALNSLRVSSERYASFALGNAPHTPSAACSTFQVLVSPLQHLTRMLSARQTRYSPLIPCTSLSSALETEERRLIDRVSRRKPRASFSLSPHSLTLFR